MGSTSNSASAELETTNNALPSTEISKPFSFKALISYNNELNKKRFKEENPEEIPKEKQQVTKKKPQWTDAAIRKRERENDVQRGSCTKKKNKKFKSWKGLHFSSDVKQLQKQLKSYMKNYELEKELRILYEQKAKSLA